MRSSEYKISLAKIGRWQAGMQVRRCFLGQLTGQGQRAARISSALLTVKAPPSSKFSSLTCSSDNTEQRIAKGCSNDVHTCSFAWHDILAGNSCRTHRNLSAKQLIAVSSTTGWQLSKRGNMTRSGIDEKSDSVTDHACMLKQSMMVKLTAPSSMSIAYLRDLMPKPLSARSSSTPIA